MSRRDVIAFILATVVTLAAVALCNALSDDVSRLFEAVGRGE